MTYTNITCICINVQSYIRYVTLHYITLHCIALHCIALHYIRTVYVYAYVYVYMYMNMYMCMCISICMCICKSICICTVYVYLHMCICIYGLTFYKSYQKLIHSRARPCPMAAMRASRMGEAQKCMLTIWWVWWLLLFPAGNHQWSSAVQKIGWINGSYRIAVIQHIYTYLTRDQKDAQSDFYDWAWLWLLPLGFLLFVKKYFLGPAVMNPTAESTDFLNNTTACLLDLLWWENAWRAWRCGVLQILQLQNI